MGNIRLQEEIREKIEKLLVIAEDFSQSKTSAHTIEKGIFKQLLVLGLSLLSYIFKKRIGQIIAQGTPKKDGIPLRNKGLEICQYLSLFGLLEIERPSVRGVLIDLLNSKITKVIKDLKRINNLNNQKQLSDTKQKQVEKAITYFTNHQHKMDYKTFIQKGYPVSSALVEAACGHLVKERMEQSGMRWSSQGAQNIMDIRALKLNDDMEDFMDFRIKKEQLFAFRYAA